ncbi:hypothetical protein HYDPIDRAFT_35592 [Hydnomerulius pinastri MD-312]|nr:hypothetical protein HYDPIDRAFT_35592 [Hydnomerulius pinastri MD-312]
MDKREKDRFVQNYIQEQEAYLCVYSAEGLLDICTSSVGTPSKQLRSARDDEFGFGTPVLRPRVGKTTSHQPSPNVKPHRKPHQKEKRASRPSAFHLQPSRHLLPDEATCSERYVGSESGSDKENKQPTPKKVGRRKPKRKKTPSVTQTDDEHEARLADRRERKRKKRAIVNPPQRDEAEESSAEPSKTAKSKGKKAKKIPTPAALALLHGFSATNIKKDRLTLKPTPALGVFGKGKASVKTKTSAAKKSVSSSNLFSEFAFLNKNATEIKGQTDDDTLSSKSSQPPTKKIRITNYDTTAKKRSVNGGNRSANSGAPEPLPQTSAPSEVWDIESQSKCPHGIPVRSDTKVSTSVIMDLRASDWFPSRNLTKGNTQDLETPESPPDVKDQVTNRSLEQESVLDRSEVFSDADAPLRDAESSSLHPSHSVSQAGPQIAQNFPPGPRLAASRFFAPPKSAVLHSTSTDPQPTTEAGDGYIQVPDYHARTPGSPVGASRSFMDFRTPYDLAPAETPDRFSEDSLYGNYYIPVPEKREAQEGVLPQHYATPPVDAPSGPSSEGDVQEFYRTSRQVERYRSSYRSYPPLGPCMYLPGEPEDEYDPGVPQYDDDGYERREQHELEYEDADSFAGAVEVRHDEELDQVFVFEDEPSAAEGGQYLDHYGQVMVDPTSLGASPVGEDSSIFDGESTHTQDLTRTADFLEGRALLSGVSAPYRQIQPSVWSYGLMEAEVDVASRLRDHWRPQRL